MAITQSTIRNNNGINFTYVVDSPADWSGVTNATYFKDLSDGLIYFKNSSGTVIPIFYQFTGGTVNGLTATTISATTYQNLPVTADTFTTGFTYSNNTFTITRNQGQPNLTATINSVTGLTATTININTIGSGTSLTNLGIDSTGRVVSGTSNTTILSLVRLIVLAGRSNSNVFLFNSNTRTADSSASPVADSAFILTTGNLTTVKLYLRQSSASSNSCRVDIFRNANGTAFSTATSIANSTQTISSADTIVVYTFSGLTLSQYDSIHVQVTPGVGGTNVYSGIITIE